jgi:hypothetical protein
MTRTIDAAETAKLIRKRLKAAFPGVTFSVKTDRYAGGSSIRIRYTDGPVLAMVKAITDAYAGGGFDGMIDMAYDCDAYLTADGRAFFAQTSGTEGSMGTVPAGKAFMPEPGAERVRFSNRYVFVDREYSPAFLERAKASCEKRLGATFEVKDLGNGRACADTGHMPHDEYVRIHQFIQRRMSA